MFAKLWRGEYSLAASFWLFYVAGQSLFVALLRLYNAVLEQGDVSLAAAAAAFVLLFLSIFYFVLSVMGLWHATERYDGPLRWSMAARLVILCEIALIAYVFGGQLGWWVIDIPFVAPAR